MQFIAPVPVSVVIYIGCAAAAKLLRIELATYIHVVSDVPSIIWMMPYMDGPERSS